MLKTFTAIRDPMMVGNHDRSDSQTDYFDVGWYIDINVGKWDKPFRCMKAAESKPAAPASRKPRVGEIRFYVPTLLDACDARTALKVGDKVQVIKSPYGCPPLLLSSSFGPRRACRFRGPPLFALR